MSRLRSAPCAGTRAEEQRLSFVQPGRVDMHGLIEQHAVLCAQFPVRRRLADVSRFPQRLDDDMLEGLVNINANRMWRAGYDNNQIKILGRARHFLPFRDLVPGGRAVTSY